MVSKNLLNVAIFFSLILFSTAGALASQEYRCVSAHITDISPSSVKIGEEFTVGIVIDNCGSVAPENVTFQLKDVSPFIGVKESLKKEVGRISYANSDRFILYHMKVSPDAVPGEYLFNYELTHGESNLYLKEEGSFSINIIGDRAELGIASIKADPVLPYQGDMVDLTIRIENSGKGTAKSVRIDADHSFQGTKQSFIGTLESNEDGPAILTFIAGEQGEYNIPLSISYIDDFGPNEIKTNLNINILPNKQNWSAIISVIFVIILIIFGVYYFFRTKNAKDKIIRQLLNGNNQKSKK